MIAQPSRSARANGSCMTISKHELYPILARRFAEGGIHACLWRDPDEFPRLIGFDMDVIVRPRCWRTARESVERALDDCGWRVLACIRRGTLHSLLAMRKDARSASDDDFLQIDLHRFLTAGAIPFVDPAPLFERAVIVAGAPFLSATDAATVSMLEARLNQSPKPRIPAAFEQATRTEPQRVAELLRGAVGDAVTNSDASDARLLRKALLQALRRRPLTFTAALWLIAWERTAAFLRPKGLLVAVSGPHGAGKSALIDALSRTARRKVCSGVDIFHTRPFLIPPAALARERGDQIRNRERKTTTTTSWLRLTIALADYWLGYWARIRPLLARGNLVIFDRYYSDYRVEPRIRGIGLGEAVMRHAGRLVPRPSLQVTLFAAPETIVARKQELDLAQASEQIRLYRSLASEFPGGLVFDTDRYRADEISKRVLCRIAALHTERQRAPRPRSPLEQAEPVPARAREGGDLRRAGDGSRRLRVLVSAYACDPGAGSEPGVGWNIAHGLASQHDVWIITRANNAPAIEAELARNPVRGLNFIYHDLPYWARFWKRGRRGAYIYYYLWQLTGYRVAAAAHAQVKFDVAHHVTFVTYWRPSFLAFLAVPFVWGPVGGRDDVPLRFWRGLGAEGIGYEILRGLGRFIAERDPLLRLTGRRCAVALATTPKTRMRLERLYKRPVGQLSQICFQSPRENGEDELSCLLRLGPPEDGVFRFVSIGNLIPLRGLHLGLEAFARCGLTDAEYWIVGHGKQRRRLERLAANLGIAGRVRFHGRVPRKEVFRLLGACQVLLHPALYESGGWACVESMAAGRPVICLDLAGPATHVTSDTGIKCRARSPEDTISQMASAMRRLAGDRALLAAMGRAARERVMQHYLVEQRLAYFSCCYGAALQGARR
jgi:glycosyltransferase involved in cell wall biosynthesis/thymidylate kinase